MLQKWSYIFEDIADVVEYLPVWSFQRRIKQPRRKQLLFLNSLLFVRLAASGGVRQDQP